MLKQKQAESFIKDTRLGAISFDDITKNMEKHRGKIQEEYDIYLTNGDSIALVEVKYKTHLEDIKKLERKFNHFKKLFPIYKDYKPYGAMASFYFNQDTKDELLKQGYFIVERVVSLISTENSDYLKLPKEITSHALRHCHSVKRLISLAH